MPITKQTIAIIGADSNIGSSIAKGICDGNYRLLLFSDDVSNVQPLAEEITQSNTSADIDVRNCKHEACWEADIIILAVPYSTQKQTAERIKDVATQKIVVSITNSAREPIENSLTASRNGTVEELKERLPNSRIVKVFYTGFTQQDIKGKKADIFLAGNNEDALESVSELFRAAGFIPVAADPPQPLPIPSRKPSRRNKEGFN